MKSAHHTLPDATPPLQRIGSVRCYHLRPPCFWENTDEAINTGLIAVDPSSIPTLQPGLQLQLQDASGVVYIVQPPVNNPLTYANDTGATGTYVDNTRTAIGSQQTMNHCLLDSNSDDVTVNASSLLSDARLEQQQRHRQPSETMISLQGSLLGMSQV